MMIIHSYDEIKTLFDNCGITAREADFDKSKPTPYIAYYRSHENPIRANGRTIYTIIKMAAELYTKRTDTATEPILEKYFRDNGIVGKKSERVFVEGENYYETVYEFELVMK